MNIADINAETRAIVDADSLSYPDALLLRRVNAAYEEIVAKLIANNGGWEFGDSNYSALPTGLQTLVANQKEYAFDSTQLTILRVEVKDINGIWQLLSPISEKEVDYALPEYYKDSALPQVYDKRENFLILYPSPSAVTTTLTNGLKVYFQRTADIFTSAQVALGVKVPGFASPYHILICYKAALPYALSYKPQRVQMIISEITRLEREMINLNGKKSKDESNIMTFNQRCYE
jgi:hypothetical protein